MEKKEVKFYEAPVVEAMELESEVSLLTVSGEGAHFPVVEDEDDEG